MEATAGRRLKDPLQYLHLHGCHLLILWAQPQVLVPRPEVLIPRHEVQLEVPELVASVWEVSAIGVSLLVEVTPACYQQAKYFLYPVRDPILHLTPRRCFLAQRSTSVRDIS